MNIHKILDENHVDEASALMRDYYTAKFKRDEVRTGARFESWAGGGDNPQDVNRITADDLVAVSFLSVEIPAPAAIGILETYAESISEYLEQIPSNLDLSNVIKDDFDGLLGEQSAALKLWRVLRQNDSERWGIGPTTASKIMARKRPRLVPIYDSIVGPLMGLPNSNRQWTVWHRALTNESGLPERLRRIQEASGVAPEASLLRVMDVVLWNYGKSIAAKPPVNDTPTP